MTVLLINQSRNVIERKRRSPLAGSCLGHWALCFFLGTGLVLQFLMLAGGFCEQHYKFQNKHPIPTSARALHEI